MRRNTGEWLSKTFDSEETSSGDRLLAMAAVIVEEMRAAIYEQTGFRCSAGIAHNKVVLSLFYDYSSVKIGCIYFYIFSSYC